MAAVSGAVYTCRPPCRVLPAAGQCSRTVIMCTASRAGREPVAIDPEATVPEVGWMWDSSSRKAAATKASLKSANIKAKKSLGQNFCTDDTILQNIVRAAGVKRSDLVIEVGPGTGNLTRHLAATGAQLVAVEKDDTLFERLQQEFAEVPQLQLVHGDVMRLNLNQLLEDMQAQPRNPDADTLNAVDATTGSSSSSRSSSSSSSPSGAEHGSDGSSSSSSSSTRAAPGRRRVKVVANLPYNITKEFLQLLLPRGDVLSELSIMIQEEVAQRLVDPTPSRKDYRAMSVFTHFYSQPLYRFLIPKEKYFPVPGVDGALVTFRLRPPGQRLSVPDERGFIQMVNQAFSERRKMLRNNMAPRFSSVHVEGALRACELRPDVRAQDLSLEQFAQLYGRLLSPEQ